MFIISLLCYIFICNYNLYSMSWEYEFSCSSLIADQMYVGDVKRISYRDTIPGECFFAHTGIFKRKEERKK